MSGSSENQQSLQNNLEKPFSGNLETAKEDLSEIKLLEGMRKFRDDLEDIYTDEVDVDASPETRRQWKLAAEYGLDNQVLQFRRIEWGLDFLDKLKLLYSSVSFFVSFSILPILGLSQFHAAIIAFVFSVLVYLIDVGLPYGQVFVNQIGYQKIPVQSAGEVVKFRSRWNNGVMNSLSCTVGIFIVGLLALRANIGYNWALRLIRWRVRLKY
jgi:hypothetical protein